MTAGVLNLATVAAAACSFFYFTQSAAVAHVPHLLLLGSMPLMRCEICGIADATLVRNSVESQAEYWSPALDVRHVCRPCVEELFAYIEVVACFSEMGDPCLRDCHSDGASIPCVQNTGYLYVGSNVII
eukprot:SAG22_NODE_1683_length_3817_cov_1.449704_2_plen_129_part_00